jgi:molecular chaperone GrpE
MKTDPTKPANDTAPADAANATTPEATKPESAAADPLAAAQRESAEFKDRLLRTLAEMENLRKRTEREVADSRIYGIASFARDVLGVADNMHRAIAAVSEEARIEGNEVLKALVDGVELTERELQKMLEKHGVKKLEPLGQKFDPNFHQAMFEVPDPNAVAGTVVQVLQGGYTLGERVLRPALVGIAKGGPKAAPAAASSSGNEPN